VPATMSLLRSENYFGRFMAINVLLLRSKANLNVNISRRQIDL